MNPIYARRRRFDIRGEVAILRVEGHGAAECGAGAFARLRRAQRGEQVEALAGGEPLDGENAQCIFGHVA